MSAVTRCWYCGTAYPEHDLSIWRGWLECHPCRRYRIDTLEQTT